MTRASALLLVSIALAFATPARAAVQAPTALDEGYRAMYSLENSAAAAAFNRWRTAHPDDPRGPASIAANLLFEELNRLGLLDLQRFVDDSILSVKIDGPIDPAWREQFDDAVADTMRLAHQRLAAAPHDEDALFSLALIKGLEADEAAFLEHRRLDALRDTREGARWARQLIELRPDAYDAYLATGIANYIVGSLNAPIRWMLRLGGFTGDRKQGIRELSLVAERGPLLSPFAQLLLAIADLRAGHRDEARQRLTALHDRFPANPLFARELRKLNQAP